METSLVGKRALVCGSSSGIGLACAIELANCGAEVTLVARSEEKLTKALGELNASSGQTHRYIAVDFSDPALLGDKVKAHIGAVGTHVILVNNTGGPPSGPIVEAATDAFAAAISSHVLCNQILAQTLLPGMKEAGYGIMVQVGGWGYQIADEGSGASFGRRAIRRSIWAQEGMAPMTPFATNVLDDFDIGSLHSGVRGARIGCPETTPAKHRSCIPLCFVG